MDAESIPALLGEIKHLEAVATARLYTPAPTADDSDRLVGVDDAAQRLGLSVSYIYQNKEKFPFIRRQGRKLLFSTKGIDEHIAGQSKKGLTARRLRG